MAAGRHILCVFRIFYTLVLQYSKREKAEEITRKSRYIRGAALHGHSVLSGPEPVSPAGISSTRGTQIAVPWVPRCKFLYLFCMFETFHNKRGGKIPGLKGGAVTSTSFGSHSDLSRAKRRHISPAPNCRRERTAGAGPWPGSPLLCEQPAAHQLLPPAPPPRPGKFYTFDPERLLRLPIPQAARIGPSLAAASNAFVGQTSALRTQVGLSGEPERTSHEESGRHPTGGNARKGENYS